jgi:integrase
MASVEKRTALTPAGRERAAYVVRWRDPSGHQRAKSFARKVDAERWKTNVEADLLRDEYIDPSAGTLTFETYAGSWLAAQTFDQSTADAVELRLRLHAFPTLGSKQLRQIKPSTVQAWLRGLDKLAPTYRQVIFANVSTVMSAAVDDELIRRNPCSASSVRRPTVEGRKVVPWEVSRVLAVQKTLPERYRLLVTLGSGLGLRQGEIFGLSPDDIDVAKGRVEVRRQVKLYNGNRAVFALPKGRKTRSVPLPETVRAAIDAHLGRFPGARVERPWGTPDGDPVAVDLIMTTRERTPLNRNYFNTYVWKPALRKAEVPDTRENGCHALRHFYASTLLDAGESIKAVSEYLGHSDAGFTLRTYTHLLPSSDERTRRAVDAVLCVTDV